MAAYSKAMLTNTKTRLTYMLARPANIVLSNAKLKTNPAFVMAAAAFMMVLFANMQIVLSYRMISFVNMLARSVAMVTLTALTGE
jgi:hypothetical protein